MVRAQRVGPRGRLRPGAAGRRARSERLRVFFGNGEERAGNTTAQGDRPAPFQTNAVTIHHPVPIVGRPTSSVYLGWSALFPFVGATGVPTLAMTFGVCLLPFGAAVMLICLGCGRAAFMTCT